MTTKIQASLEAFCVNATRNRCKEREKVCWASQLAKKGLGFKMSFSLTGAVKWDIFIYYLFFCLAFLCICGTSMFCMFCWCPAIPEINSSSKRLAQRRFTENLKLAGLRSNSPVENEAENGTSSVAQQPLEIKWILPLLQSRGSENPNTGPIRDRSSFGSNRVTGAFAHIDASAPRRPQDKARLVSSEFQATDPNNPLCLRYVLGLRICASGHFSVSFADFDLSN